MRVLHVAALPFPSPQGTQGLLHAMLMAHAEAGHDAHLLCYPGSPLSVPYTLHRCAPPQPVSLASGPSWQKVALDAWLARALQRLHTGFDAVIAHHVEAASVALALRIPACFYAHTDLGAELPSYFEPRLKTPLRWLGAAVDSLLSRRMRTFAVSPRLAERLGAEVLPLPWTVPAPIAHAERQAARAFFQLRGRTALYAGNLDRYQGLAPVVQAIARTKDLHWLVATEAPIRDFARALKPFFGRVRFARLNDEAARRRAYAACDFAVVPRAVPGGVPIKLFDALARGVPVIAARTALAGYPLERFCTLIDHDWHFDLRPRDDARAYLRAMHAPARFAELSASACRPDVARA
jgi:glycosyltransferase involved in cell wall biosynthesis